MKLHSIKSKWEKVRQINNSKDSTDLPHVNFNPPTEHVIGTFDTGSVVAQNLLVKSRLQAGIVSVVMMKKIINILTKYCVDTSQSGIKLM